MSNLPASLMSSLTNIKGFDKQAFEAVHASGEQVTSVRLNPLKVQVVNSEKSKVNEETTNVNREPSIMNKEVIDVKRETTDVFENSTVDEKQNGPLFTIDDSGFTAHDAAPEAGSHQPAVCKLKSAIPWCPSGLLLPSRPSFTFDPLFHAGVYYVQEASSMFLWEVLRQTVAQNTTGLKVLDLCAAPGGKSTLLASYFTDGLVVANEVIRSRAAILVENITKWGAANTVVTNNDPKDFTRLEGYFDVMVVDAPCSGSGLFRRDANAIEEWSEDNVELCSQRQQRILADAWPALKNDGVLIYSTCSYSKQEDEDMLDWIREECNAENIRLELKEEWGIVETVSDKHSAFGYRFYPYNVKGEGFFIAAFRKKEGDTKEYRVQGLAKAGKEESAAAAQFITGDEMFYFKQGENIIAIPKQWQTDVAVLQKHLYLRKAGITVGALKGKDVVPAHELAMSTAVDKNVPRVPLTRQQAIQYLQKKDLQLNNFAKGWALATYHNISLGWLKVLHNRVNNYYPVEWRILKDKMG